MSKPFVLIMCGLPYSGKSHFAETLAAREGIWARLISLDREVLGLCVTLGVSYREGWAECVGPAAELMERNVRSLFAEDSVIWDQTNLTRRKRRSIVGRVGAGRRVGCVYIETPPEQVERSIEEGKVPEKVWRDMAARLEVPTPEEFPEGLFHLKRPYDLWDMGAVYDWARAS